MQLRKWFASALACLGLTVTAEAETPIPGLIITGDEIWGVSGSPYLVTGKIDIPSGASLTIEPGVVVDFGTSYIEFGVIRVWGDLVASGAIFDGTQVQTAENWFVVELNSGATATLTDCSFHGRWTPSNAHGKDWRGVQWFDYGTGPVVIEGCEFIGFNDAIVLTRDGAAEIRNCRFSGNNVDIGADHTSAAIVTDCAFENVTLYSIVATKTSSLSVERCTFSESPGATGIYTSETSTFNVEHSCFSGYAAAIHNVGSTLVVAENNWWNSPTGPTHPDNPAGTGEVVIGEVDFVPFLSTPGSCRQVIVAVDIKPGSCPNPINVRPDHGSLQRAATHDRRHRYGVVPVAILGSEEFDVMNVRVSSIRLAGISPLRHAYEDVSSPVPSGTPACGCTTDGPDGAVDLTLKFDGRELSDALSQFSDRETIPITLTGELNDGTAILGEDCVLILRHDSDHFENSSLSTASEGGIASLSNSPNPFNAGTTIVYSLEHDGWVGLGVIDVLGRSVTTLVNEYQSAGHHQVLWNGMTESGERAASGIYFTRLVSGERVESRMMVLLK